MHNLKCLISIILIHPTKLFGVLFRAKNPINEKQDTYN